MKITKKQIRQLDNGETTVRDLFPDVFKEKFTGWAKDTSKINEKWIGYLIDGRLQYGISADGNWFSEEVGWKHKGIMCNEIHIKSATKEEIESALTKEAIKIGFVEGVDIIPLNINLMCNKPKHTTIDNSVNYELTDWESNTALWVSSGLWNSVIFEDGKWAEILSSKKRMSNKTITFSDGFQWLELSPDKARDLWDKIELFEVREDEQSEATINTKEELEECILNNSAICIELGFGE